MEKKSETKEEKTPPESEDAPWVVYVDGSYVGDERKGEESGRGGAGIYAEIAKNKTQVSLAVPVPTPVRRPHQPTPLAYDPLRAELYAALCVLHHFKDRAKIMCKSDCLKAVVILRNVKSMTVAPREYLSYPCSVLRRAFPATFGFTGQDDFAGAGSGTWGPQDFVRYVDVLDAWWHLTRAWNAPGRSVQVEWIPGHTADPVELSTKLALSGTHVADRARALATDAATDSHRGNRIADELAAKAREKSYWTSTGRSAFVGFPLYPEGMHSDVVFEITSGLPSPDLWDHESRPLLCVSKADPLVPEILDYAPASGFPVPRGAQLFDMWTSAYMAASSPSAFSAQF